MELILEAKPIHPFLQWYEQILIKSGLFHVKREPFKEYEQYLEAWATLLHGVNRPKYGGICFIKVNGALIILEAMMRPIHYHRLHKMGVFNNIKADLWITYYSDISFEDRAGCPMKPWVMFPSGWDTVNKFDWSNKNHTHTGILTSGKHSAVTMKRLDWINKCKELGDFFATSHAVKPRKYLNALKDSKWGIIISTHRLKNTREYEFPSNGIPMAINYKPVYEYPFNPDEHYVLLETPDDLEKLRTIDAAYYSRQSQWIWDHYLRPDRAAGLLLRMLP